MRCNRTLIFRPILAALAAFSLCACAGQDVYLAWAPSQTPDVMGYALYYGNASGAYNSRLDVGTNTSAVVTNLSNGSIYFFAAVAYDADGAESVPSEEVSFTVPMPPLPFLVQQIRKQDETLILSWGAISGQTYQVEYATDLNQTNWIESGNPVLATNSTPWLSLNIGTDPQRFYRLRLIP